MAGICIGISRALFPFLSIGPVTRLTGSNVSAVNSQTRCWQRSAHRFAGTVVLDFTVEESEDLITWTPVAGPGVSKTLTLPEGKRFYRFAH